MLAGLAELEPRPGKARTAHPFSWWGESEKSNRRSFGRHGDLRMTIFVGNANLT